MTASLCINLTYSKSDKLHSVKAPGPIVRFHSLDTPCELKFEKPTFPTALVRFPTVRIQCQCIYMESMIMGVVYRITFQRTANV